jgi:hypothetical protein
MHWIGIFKGQENKKKRRNARVLLGASVICGVPEDFSL